MVVILRQTSMLAHQDIQADGTAKTQRMTIIKLLRRFSDGLTRQETSRLLGIPINAVCGRVRELIKVGSVYEDGKKFDKYSRKSNYILKASEIKEVVV